MALDDDRWIEISPSQFDHETAGLNIIRELLPNLPPYRAWSNFEFRDNHGRWHEVDLLVLARDQLHLIELKHYYGTIRGDDHRWVRHNGRREDNPLKLARRKAQYLATRLKDSLRDWARQHNRPTPDPREAVPFIQESVFLHHDVFRSELSDRDAIGLYGLDGQEHKTGLPGISELLLAEPDHYRTTTSTHDRVVPVLMERLGLKPQQERTAGSWVIEHSLLSQGEGWQDWSARHQITPGQKARIRFRVAPDGASQATTSALNELATHEYATMSRLVHDGLLRPLDVVDSELGTGVVYPATEDLHRLDLWLTDRQLSLDTQLAIVRQIAEAVHYAHGSTVAHRALTPEAIWIKAGDDGVKVLVGDWHSAGLTEQGTHAADGVTSLMQASPLHTGPDADPHAGFRAPEGAWTASAADRFRLDTFGVGALAYYLLTGSPPATTAAGLRERLRTQGGLDISPELPEADEPLRNLILNATRPAPSNRTPDLAAFLEELSLAEAALAEPEEPTADPLEAHPGAILNERFTLIRRLGQGSTAVGLLVRDEQNLNTPERVLKVALDDDAARRLEDEAAVLERLKHPRLVRLLEGPINVGNRRALLLESAGTKTLAEVMRERTRLSLDLLQRYGTDLLEALVALDRAGVDHRDIKPANLGVQESRSDRAKHLVLFDFSLTRAAASATEAGTPPYLDPFLGVESRERYDSAAERYAAAVVLFEMATGQAPVYGDGVAHPASVTDEATVSGPLFDQAISRAMVSFFRTALARDAAARHHTAAQMLTEWQAAFPDALTTIPDDAEALASAATIATPLSKSGLSARALSALEPLEIRTVGDLAQLDTLALNISGVAGTTRQEVRKRWNQWREKFDEEIRTATPHDPASALPSPLDAVDLLSAHTGRGATQNKRRLVSLLLGVAQDAPAAFATHAGLGARLEKPVTPARASQLLTDLQQAWARNSRTLQLLTTLDANIRERLKDLGDVATVDELSATVLEQMAPRGIVSDSERDEHRIAAGLVRIVLDRQRALARADDDVEPLVTRRQENRPVLIATDPALLDVAEALGYRADHLVTTSTGADHDRLVPADVVATHLEPIIRQIDHPPAALTDPARLTRLAGDISTQADASAAAELHHHDLPAPAAVAHALRGLTATQQLKPATIQSRVRARFPALPDLPNRPALDDVIARADVGLIYDSAKQIYRSHSTDSPATGFVTHEATNIAVEAAPVSPTGVIGQRLQDSRSRRSFLALGVPGHRLYRALRVLTSEYGAHHLDVTEILLTELRSQAQAVGMKWTTVEAADAAATGSRPAQGLATLVARAVPAVTAAVEAAMDADGERPVLLTDAATLARYGHLMVLTQWTDLTRPRRQAVWLVVPQLRGNQGPLLDGHPVTLNSPGQFVRLDSEWIDTRDRALDPSGAAQ